MIDEWVKLEIIWHWSTAHIYVISVYYFHANSTNIEQTLVIAVNLKMRLRAGGTIRAYLGLKQKPSQFEKNRMCNASSKAIFILSGATDMLEHVCFNKEFLFVLWLAMSSKTWPAWLVSGWSANFPNSLR